MTHAFRILTLLALLTLAGAWTTPTLAARLASVNGQADATETNDYAEFKLGEQTTVSVEYGTTKRADGCAVLIQVERWHKGDWHTVNTVLRANQSKKGSRSLNLPAGSYRIKVVAKHSRYDVSVDN